MAPGTPSQPAAAAPAPAGEPGGPGAKKPASASSSGTSAEPATKPPAESPPPPPARQVQEANPPLYYLKDKDGNLVPVPGYRLEDFEQMVQKRYRSAETDPTPRYTLQSVAATGAAKTDHVEMSFLFKFLVHEDGWVRIPLRLDQAVLRGQAQHRGPGSEFLHFEPGGEGYVVWIRSGSGKEHELTLEALVPVVRVGEDTRLRLAFPRAASSEMKLTVPSAGVTAEVSEGATLLPPSASGESATLLSAAGIGGDFSLTWRKTGSQQAETQAVLESVGAIQVKVEGRSIETEAKLSVRSLGGPFDAFRVRLPKGAEYAPGKAAQYTVVPLAAAARGNEDRKAEDRKVVEVRFPKKVAAPVDVQLNTRTVLDAAGDSSEVAAYEVIGAARQSGHVAIRAGSQWRVFVGRVRGARQIDELPPPLRSDDVVAGFEYFLQPCSLPIQVARRTPRVSLDPEYLLLVDADQVTLEAKLKYVVRAAEVASFDVDLPGWSIDEVGPENLVANDGIVTRADRVSIPLAQRSIGPIEITLSARRKIPAESKSLVLELPHPQADSQTSAAVVVLAGDNVELIPNPEAMVGLVRQQVVPQMKLPQRQQDPLFYRAEPAKAVFAAGFRVHPQKVTVGVASDLRFDEQRAEIEEKLTYLVAYKSVDRLTLAVPHALAGNEQLAIRFEGKPLSPVDLPDPNDQPDLAGPAHKQVILPGARIGPCELTIRYGLDLEKLLPRSGVSVSIPLVMPGEGELSGNRLIVSAKDGIRVRQSEGPWKEDPAGVPPTSARRGLQLACSERTADVSLAVQLDEQGSAGTTVVNRAWVQTWLTPALREDRAVMRLSTTQKNLDFVVPAGVNPAEVELWLDGKRTAGQSTPDLHLIVPLPAAEGLSQHELEAIYQFPGPRPEAGRMSLELPRLGRGAWVHRLYWQLVLPRNEQVMVAPADFTGEFCWGWNGLFWGRIPVLEQPQLEAWCGSRRLIEVPADTNRYLFSTLGSVTRCELRTGHRAFIVMAASGAALVFGLLLIYIPAARHPAALLVGAVLLGACAFSYPEATLLVAQAASLGVLLSLVAAVMRRGVVRRHPPPAREISSSIFERGSSGTSRRGAAMDDVPDQAPVSIMDSRE